MTSNYICFPKNKVKFGKIPKNTLKFGKTPKSQKWNEGKCLINPNNLANSRTIGIYESSSFIPKTWFQKSYMSKDKPFHPQITPKGHSFLSSNPLLISSIFRTFLSISSAHSLLLSSHFSFLLWQFHGCGQHAMTGPDLFFFLLFSLSFSWNKKIKIWVKNEVYWWN